MNLPENLKYTESHEWIDPETGKVGITDHAQNELNDVVYVEPPEAGTAATQGDPIAVVESVKAASDIYAPADGEVVEGNAALADNPGLVNSDPYGEGWLFKLKVADAASLDQLLSASDYQTQIGG